MTAAIGIDVGGSQLRVAAVDAFGLVMTCYRRARIGVDRYDALINWLATQASRLYAEVARDRPLGVGLAVPGTLDDRRRAVVRSTNLDVIERRPIAEDLAVRTGLRVSLHTDAEAATWAEYQALGAEVRRFVHLRIGTGVACGVVVDGELERIDMQRSTHWELLIVDDGPAAKPCPCGLRGCLEVVVSGAALTKRTVQADCGKRLTDLERAWQRRDDAARAIVDEASKALATAIQRIATQLYPEVICVGGGVVEALPSLLDETRQALENGPAPWVGIDASEAVPAAPIVLTSSALGDEAGVIGAALLALNE